MLWDTRVPGQTNSQLIYFQFSMCIHAHIAGRRAALLTMYVNSYCKYDTSDTFFGKGAQNT